MRSGPGSLGADLRLCYVQLSKFVELKRPTSKTNSIFADSWQVVNGFCREKPHAPAKPYIKRNMTWVLGRMVAAFVLLLFWTCRMMRGLPLVVSLFLETLLVLLLLMTLASWERTSDEVVKFAWVRN